MLRTAKAAGDLRRTGPEYVERVFRKWLRGIPLPLRPEDRRAGYDWDRSIWQMEMSLTQIFRPASGPTDSYSIGRIHNEPPREFGGETMRKIRGTAKGLGTNV
jgi:hypothetical protein